MEVGCRNVRHYFHGRFDYLSVRQNRISSILLGKHIISSKSINCYHRSKKKNKKQNKQKSRKQTRSHTHIHTHTHTHTPVHLHLSHSLRSQPPPALTSPAHVVRLRSLRPEVAPASPPSSNAGLPPCCTPRLSGQEGGEITPRSLEGRGEQSVGL